MDTYSEQLVVRASTGADKAKKILISIGAILLATVLMWLSIVFAFYSLILLVFGVLGLGVYLVSNMDVEYEYIITNNEMDVDKIIGRRKRKRMITLDLASAEDFGPYPANEDIEVDSNVHVSAGNGNNERSLHVQQSIKVAFAESFKVDATVHASTGYQKDAHYLLVQHGSYGKVMLIFNPNEKTREAIMQEVPNQLRIRLKHNGK